MPQDKPRLRLSTIGRPDRQLWYDFKQPRTESFLPSTRIKFLYGYILEELLIMLASISGHKVTQQQKQVEEALAKLSTSSSRTSTPSSPPPSLPQPPPPPPPLPRVVVHRRARLVALRPIRPWETLTICYLDVRCAGQHGLWSTRQRRRVFLESKRFWCECASCRRSSSSSSSSSTTSRSGVNEKNTTTTTISI